MEQSLPEDKKDGQEPLITQTPPLAPTPNPSTPPTDSPAKPPSGLDFMDLVYGIFFTPRKTIRQVVDNPPFSQALVVFFIVNILSTILMAVSLGNTLSSRVFSKAPAAFIVAGLVIGFFDWFVVTGIFHLLAEFFGGRSRGLALFTLVALANLPRLLNVPVALISFTPARALGVLLSLAITGWVAVLYVIAISEVHGLSTGQSVAVVLLPLGAVILALIVVIIAFAGLAASLLPLIERGAPLLPGL